MQGFYDAKPFPPDEITAFLREWGARSAYRMRKARPRNQCCNSALICARSSSFSVPAADFSRKPFTSVS